MIAEVERHSRTGYSDRVGSVQTFESVEVRIPDNQYVIVV